MKCVQTSLYNYEEDNVDSVLQVAPIIIGFQVHGILDETLQFTLAQGTLEVENFHRHSYLKFWLHVLLGLLRWKEFAYTFISRNFLILIDSTNRRKKSNIRVSQRLGKEDEREKVKWIRN